METLAIDSMKRTPQKKATIKDIANLVGVHHSTVSRALSPDNNPKISPAVVKKIQKAAKQLGYFPNILASALKKNRSFAIGVLIPDLMNQLFPPIIRGIQDTAEPEGFSVLISNTDDEEEKEMLALRSLRSRSIEGLIVATAHRKDPVVDECIERNIPFVLVNRTVDNDDVSAVIIDEEFAMRSILEHLTGANHKRIGHIAGPQQTSTGFERATFFSNYMRLHSLSENLIEATDKFTIEEGKRAFNELYRRDKSISAIVACSDLIALGCLDAIEELGLRVPEDISVVGNNNIPMVARMTPGLTTISIPKYEMGVQAARILLDIVQQKNNDHVVMKMRPKLIVRGTTAVYRN